MGSRITARTPPQRVAPPRWLPGCRCHIIHTRAACSRRPLLCLRHNGMLVHSEAELYAGELGGEDHGELVGDPLPHSTARVTRCPSFAARVSLGSRRWGWRSLRSPAKVFLRRPGSGRSCGRNRSSGSHGSGSSAAAAPKTTKVSCKIKTSEESAGSGARVR